MPQRFGEMLVSRRREMGMSIQQVSNITKIRPQIIEYVETENFQALPSRGYAQGIISSYARFLGLDPNQVVDAYFDALDEYRRFGAGASSGRFQEVTSEANLRSAQAASRYHLIDPNRAGSRYAQRPPQAGYVPESSSPHEPMETTRLRPSSAADRRRSPALAGNGYSQRNTTGRQTQQRRYDHAGAMGDYRSAQQRRRPAEAYDPREGRPSSRAGYGHDPRRGDPRMSRTRGNGQAPRGGRNGRNAAPRGGRGAGRSNNPLNPKVFVGGAIIVLLLIVLIVVTLLRGCAPKNDPTTGSTPTAVQKVDKKQDDTSSKDDDGSDSDGADSNDDNSDNDRQSAQEPEKTVVKVTVKEEGVVAWVEVKLDGKSVLAKQVVGPFEQEYTVEQQIDITTDTPNEVTVYKNGKKVRYDTKVSGVAKVSISAPKPETVDLTVDTDGDGIADMTAEDARDAGYDVESRTVATITISKSEYESSKSSSDSSE